MQSEHLTDEQISAAVDDALADTERGAALQHLRGCPACAVRIEQTKHVVNLVQRLPRHPLPRSFILQADDLGLRTAPAPAPIRFRRSLRDPLRLLSSLAAALMVVLFVADAVRPAPLSSSGGAAIAPTSALFRAAEAPSFPDAPQPGQAESQSARAFPAPAAPASSGAAELAPRESRLGSAANQAADEAAAAPERGAAAAAAVAPLQESTAKATDERSDAQPGRARTVSEEPLPRAAPITPGPTPLQVGGLGLGLLAIILAIASIVARRSRRTGGKGLLGPGS